MGNSSAGSEELKTYAMEKDSLLAWQEKVFLHLADNKVQTKGSLFFKAYLVAGPMRERNALSKVLRIELIDENGTVIKRQHHPIEGGMVSGNLTIPKKTEAGNYYLKAYTRWMQNYGENIHAKQQVFVRSRKNSQRSNFDQAFKVQVFSEGGRLVNNLQNRLVIKIEDQEGAIDGLSGEITDQYGNVVGKITGFSGGLYTTLLIPESGKEYQLNMPDGKNYPLPKATDEGYSLKVNNLGTDKSLIRVKAVVDEGGSSLKLIGEMNGIRYLDRVLELKGPNALDLEFPKSGIPRGVLVLRLLNDHGEEMATRPVWIDGDELNINVYRLLDEPVDPQEQVFRVEVTDKNDKPVQAEVAISVREDLNMQLPGLEQVSKSDSFELFSVSFLDDPARDYDLERNERFLKDIGLLTKVHELNQTRYPFGTVPEHIKYPLQKGLEFAGYAYDMENNLLKKTDVQVMSFSEGQIWAQEFKTDAKGRLFIENIDLEGESELVFRKAGETSESRLVKVVPDSEVQKVTSKTISKSKKYQKTQ